MSPFYDPMVAKIISWGADRDIARRRLVRALSKTSLFGFTTNREFLIDVLSNDAFVAGEATTAFINEQFADGFNLQQPDEDHLFAAAVLQHRQLTGNASNQLVAPDLNMGNWSGSLGLQARFKYLYTEGNEVEIVVRQVSQDSYLLSGFGRQIDVLWIDQINTAQVRLRIDGVQKNILYCYLSDDEIGVQINGRAHVFNNLLSVTGNNADAAGSGAIIAPMHGNLLALNVCVGDCVEAGQEVAVMEAMKMEHRLRAETAGEITAIYAKVGEQVSSGSIILEVSTIQPNK